MVPMTEQGIQTLQNLRIIRMKKQGKNVSNMANTLVSNYVLLRQRLHEVVQCDAQVITNVRLKSASINKEV